MINERAGLGTKPAFKSKTVWAAIVPSLIVYFWPGAWDVFVQYPEISLIINSILIIMARVMARHILYLLCLTLMVSCASTFQQLDPKLFYKRDVQIAVNGQTYEGVTTIPKASSYDITVSPKGGMDFVLISSCHREETFEKKTRRFLWWRVGGNSWVYRYTPNPGLEEGRVCPLRVQVFESSQEQRHSWALITFEDPKNYKLQGHLDCNGRSLRVNGVGSCQAKRTTVQRIRWSLPTQSVTQERCNKPIAISPGEYEITATLGECLYHFRSQGGKIGRLTMVGYEGVLVREGQ